MCAFRERVGLRTSYRDPEHMVRRQTAVQILAFLLLVAGLAYLVISSADSWADWVVFGVLGYLFKKLKYPLAPLVLALVLGDMAETAFRQSMLLSRGEL